MAPEYLGADADQHDTAEDFRPFAEQRAERPTIMPSVDIISVAQPIASAVAIMLTCKNARPTPTAIASRLVAKAVVTSSQKP